MLLEQLKKISKLDEQSKLEREGQERRKNLRRDQDKAFKTIVKHLIQTQKAVRSGDTQRADKLLSVAINAMSKMFMR